MPYCAAIVSFPEQMLTVDVAHCRLAGRMSAAIRNMHMQDFRRVQNKLTSTKAKCASLKVKSAQDRKRIAKLEQDVASSVLMTPSSERSSSATMPVTPPPTESEGLPTPSPTPLGIAQAAHTTPRHAQLARPSGVSSTALTRQYERSVRQVYTS